MSASVEMKARAFCALQKLAGYVEDGSDTRVALFQDDATRTWHVEAGKISAYGASLLDAVLSADAILAKLEAQSCL